MGELLLCKQSAAEVPYYIEGIGWNVYTLEELCYYVENNIYLLEHDFMTEELCSWIEKEMKNEQLAEKLYTIMQRDGRLSKFVAILLSECGYSPKDIVEYVVAIIHEMEEKTDFERNKIRADRLLENEKYISCMYEYKLLLASEDAKGQESRLIGNIWNNLGTAYARLFLFEEAIHCYEEAYSKNQSVESLKQYVMACYCYYEDTDELESAIGKYNLDACLLQGIKNEMDMAYKSERLEKFGERFGSIVALKALGRRGDYQKEIGKMIFSWKEEYRRICRI